MFSIGNLLGRDLVVDYALLNNFHLQLIQPNEPILFRLSGTIMESAKVVESIRLIPQHNEIQITIYASLVIWNRQGSPDFDLTKSLQLASGNYDIQYLGKNRTKTFLRRVEIRHGHLVN
jgi:hypothetical protein